MRFRRTHLALGSLLLMTTVAACSCDGDKLLQHNAGVCEPSFKCQAGFEYRLGECRAARCTADGDCCPGQKCNVAAGFCADQFVACSDDSQCTEVPGQACIDFRGGKFCGYPNA